MCELTNLDFAIRKALRLASSTTYTRSVRIGSFCQFQNRSQSLSFEIMQNHDLLSMRVAELSNCKLIATISEYVVCGEGREVLHEPFVLLALTLIITMMLI